MSNKYLITIDGFQTHSDGEEESISLSTVGEFRRDQDRFFITYNESAATGFDGDVTSLEIESDKKVTLNRKGNSNTQLIIERGQRHLSHYNTGYGDLMVGIQAEAIQNHLDDSGGKLLLRYSLDVNASELSVNKLNITVKEIGTQHV